MLSVAFAPSEALHKRSLLVQAYLVRRAKQACAEFEDFIPAGLVQLVQLPLLLCYFSDSISA